MWLPGVGERGGALSQPTCEIRMSIARKHPAPCGATEAVRRRMREVREHPTAANRWECVGKVVLRAWRPAANEQGGRGKNHEIGVSEFSSGERPPGTVVCLKVRRGWHGVKLNELGVRV